MFFTIKHTNQIKQPNLKKKKNKHRKKLMSTYFKIDVSTINLKLK